MDFSTIEITSKKESGNKNVRELFLVKTTWIFRPEKLHQKSAWKQCGIFDHLNYIEKSMWKKRRYVEKSTWKQRVFFNQRNYSEKSMWNRRGFFHH